MLVKLGIWRDGSQGIAKKTFFWNPSSIILLEIRGTFLSLLQPWHDCARLILHNNDIHKNLNCTFYKKLVYQDTISWNWVALTVSRKHYLTSVNSDLIVSLRNKVYNVTHYLISTEPWSQQSKVENWKWSYYVSRHSSCTYRFSGSIVFYICVSFSVASFSVSFSGSKKYQSIFDPSWTSWPTGWR